MTRLASQRSLVPPFHVMEVIAAAADQEARTGERVLHLEAGQPSAGAPPSAVAEAQRLLASGATLGYTPTLGIAALRQRVAAWYAERYDVDVPVDRVVITAGATGAMVSTLLARFDAGQRVAFAVPGYACYPQLIAALGLQGVPVRVGPGDGFLLGLSHLEALLDADGNPTIDGVIIASPANPTGTQYPPEQLAEVLAWCSANGVQLIADELYHGITFDEPAPTAATSGDAVVIGSFSKYFCMTGWRLGWMLAPDELVAAVDRLSQHFYLSPPTLAQHIAIAAFDDVATLDAEVERYATNRSIMSAALTEIGVRDIAPCDGAFYLYGDVSHWGIDSFELAGIWLRELGVAVTPGIDFDHERGGDWIRWSIAGSTTDISEACARLRAWASDRTVADHG